MHTNPQNFAPAGATPPAAPGLQPPRPPAAAGGSTFVPLMVLAAALLGWLAFQGFALWQDRQQLAGAQLALDAQEQNAAKLRAALDGVATATAKLADGGNANARVIVDELRKRGVTINPPSPPKAP